MARCEFMDTFRSKLGRCVKEEGHEGDHWLAPVPAAPAPEAAGETDARDLVLALIAAAQSYGEAGNDYRSDDKEIAGIGGAVAQLRDLVLATLAAQAREIETLRARAERTDAVLARIGTPWTPELREQLVRTYDMRYEELSEDLYDDGDGTMSIREKEERSMAAVLGVFRWWLVSGEIAHHRDALAALAARAACRAA